MPSVLGENLISYKKVIEFLEAKGKGKNFFNTLRTRHKLIHKPITRPPVTFSIPEMKIKVSRGRSIFYLQEIIPFLDEVIRLHDEEHLTFKQLEEKLRGRKHQLDELRKLELSDERRLKPAEFSDQFEIAKLKLSDYLEWPNGSKERQFLNYISEERQSCGKSFYSVTKTLVEAIKERNSKNYGEIMVKRENFGKRLDFCHQIMEAVVSQFKDLLKTGKIKMSADDWREIVGKINSK